MAARFAPGRHDLTGRFHRAHPGARKVNHLEDNVGAVDVVLTAKDLADIAAAVPRDAVAGKRYTDEGLKLVNG